MSGLAYTPSVVTALGTHWMGCIPESDWTLWRRDK